MKFLKDFKLAFAFFVFLSISCKEEKTTNPDLFDRTDFLKNMADGLIKPAYNQLLTESEKLNNLALTFVQNPDSIQLNELQNSWTSAYSTWQKANAFNFGPAGEEGTRKSLLEEIAVFPVNEFKINSIVNGGSFNVNDFNRDARGFLAIEYLIFSSNGKQTSVLNSFSSPAKVAYLKVLTQHVYDRIKVVSDAWNGSFREEFLNNNGTESGSSTSSFYNEFVKSFEALKNFKLGLPLGKRPGQTHVDANLLEARYSGKSLQFLKLHIQNLNLIWNGKPFQSDVDGPGFKEYLDNVEGGKALVISSESQMNNVIKAANEIPVNASLAEQLIRSPAPLENLHTELQKQTRFFKSDMSSVLGIAITYSSGDGD